MGTECPDDAPVTLLPPCVIHGEFTDEEDGVLPPTRPYRSYVVRLSDVVGGPEGHGVPGSLLHPGFGVVTDHRGVGRGGGWTEESQNFVSPRRTVEVGSVSRRGWIWWALGGPGKTKPGSCMCPFPSTFD